MTSEQLKALGQKAFALVTGVNPEEVSFEEGTLFHKCKWQSGCNVFEGNFYHWIYHDDDSGTVCITHETKEENWPNHSFPFSWHHLWGINSAEPVLA